MKRDALKIKVFDQVAAARTGQKTVNQATESILDIVEQNEQLFAFGEHLQKHFGCFLSTEHLQQEIDVFKGKKLPTTTE